MKRLGVLGALAILGSVAAGCGNASSSSSPPMKAGRFRLDEWSITADRATLHAGRQTITATNIGHRAHELVIVAADDAASLPTGADGSVDEERLAAVKVGEIADVAAGGSTEKTFTLPAGSYVAFCNVVDQMGSGMGGMGGGMGMDSGMNRVHFALGMHTNFRVTT
jgi:hypothetical protein